jgi:cytochrome c6
MDFLTEFEKKERVGMKLRSVKVKRATMILFAVAALAVAGTSPSPRVRGAAAEDAKSLFRENCAICHGVNGGGTDTGKKLNVLDLRSPEVQKETNEQLTEVILKGKNKMPGYEGKLSDEQIKKLVAHIRTLAKKS